LRKEIDELQRLNQLSELEIKNRNNLDDSFIQRIEDIENAIQRSDRVFDFGFKVARYFIGQILPDSEQEIKNLDGVGLTHRQIEIRADDRLSLFDFQLPPYSEIQILKNALIEVPNWTYMRPTMSLINSDNLIAHSVKYHHHSGISALIPTLSTILISFKSSRSIMKLIFRMLFILDTDILLMFIVFICLLSIFTSSTRNNNISRRQTDIVVDINRIDDHRHFKPIETLSSYNSTFPSILKPKRRRTTRRQRVYYQYREIRRNHDQTSSKLLLSPNFIEKLVTKSKLHT